jgi:hypothetical protein
LPVSIPTFFICAGLSITVSSSLLGSTDCSLSFFDEQATSNKIDAIKKMGDFMDGNIIGWLGNLVE